MKVVVGVDGSELSYQAVQFMGRLLSPNVDDLLLYFSPPEFHLSSKTSLPPEVLESAASALAAGVFEKAMSCLPSGIQEVTSAMRSEALPAAGLTALAEDEDVDLVVLGSKSAARRFPFILGSTARTVIHHTGKPVMVVRGDDDQRTGPLKVIIACDEDRWCDATGVLRDFSWPDGTEAILFHVTEALGDQFVESLMTQGSSRVPNSASLIAEYREAIAKRKDDFVKRLKSLQQTGPNLVKNAAVEVTQGDVVDEIVAKVERENADLLVVSSRKLSLIGRMLGSVTESLLTRCPCSLLIVHDHESETPKADSKQERQLA